MNRYDTALVSLSPGQSKRLRNDPSFFQNIESQAIAFKAELWEGEEVGITFETLPPENPDFNNHIYNELKLKFGVAESIEMNKLTIFDVIVKNWTLVDAKVNILIMGD